MNVLQLRLLMYLLVMLETGFAGINKTIMKANIVYKNILSYNKLSNYQLAHAQR